MRKSYISLILIVFIAIVLNACNKDTDVFVPYPGQITGPDSSWYSSLSLASPLNNLTGSLALAPDIDSMYVTDSSADTVLTASGLQCIFPVNSCADVNGSPVSGTVYVESYLLKGKGQLIRMGLPTASNGNLLVSGGSFSIGLRKGNETIQLAPNAHISVQYMDTSISQQMQLFTTVTTNSGQLNWVPDTDSSDKVSAYSSYYNISCNQLQWINCGHFYGDTSNNNKTSIAVKLPSNLTNVNTVAYIVFNGIRSLMPMNGDVTSKTFISRKVPAGLSVTVVTISKDGNFYYLGQQNITTALPTASTSSQFVTITPVRYSLDDIKLYLSSF